MSEFQYYEFYSIDRELTRAEREEVDKLSSRFSPTARRAVFTYSYSDFRHDPETVLLKYFDFFIYLSNWGTKRMMFKIPLALVSYEEIKAYRADYIGEYTDMGMRILKSEDIVLIDINLSEEESEGWIDEDQAQLSTELRSLRQDILEGDYRCLFIMWLHINFLGHNSGQFEEDLVIPLRLIPSNLTTSNSRLDALIEFYNIDPDWIAAAARYSPDVHQQAETYTQSLNQLPIEKKDEFLLKILQGEQNLKFKLRKELEAFQEKGRLSQQRRGTIALSQLLSVVEEETFKRLEIDREEAEQAHIRRMEETARQKEAILSEIDYLIQKGSGKSYNEALQKIIALRDLAIYKNDENEFEEWLSDLRTAISHKPAMLGRLSANGM